MVSGNTGFGGIWLAVDSSDNVIAGNYIGTDATGLAALPNAKDGIHMKLGSNRNRIGTNADGIADTAKVLELEF